MVNAITIEREFGCGASEIASLVAGRLGWSLWDERLTQEIARLTESTPEAVERREWRRDPVVYRVFQDFLRGGFEGGLPPTNRLHFLDARRIAAVSETAFKTALSNGPSLIVGRGSQFFPPQSQGCLPCISLCISRSKDPQTDLQRRNSGHGNRASRHNGQSARCIRPAVSRAAMAGTPPVPRNVQYRHGRGLYGHHAG